MTAPTAQAELDRLRTEVDHLDRILVHGLAERQRLVEAVARLKGDPSRVRDPARVEAVLANVLTAAEGAGLSPDIALPVWRVLVERSAAHEADLLHGRVAPAAPLAAAVCCGCDGCDR